MVLTSLDTTLSTHTAKLNSIDTDTGNMSTTLNAIETAVEVETSLPMPMVGHITSSYYSPNLGRSIALALVKSGTKKKGTKLIVPTVNKSIEVEITSPVFIDPENERLFA